MDRPIDTGGDKLLIVSNGEAYGEAALSQPIATNIGEFEKRTEAHCVKELERKLWWPEATALFVHYIKDFTPFQEAVLFENGAMVNYQPDEAEQKLIAQAGELPKMFVIDDNAVDVFNGDSIITAYC